MTKWAEFAKKTYEKYFSQQIARATNVTFSPGTVNEFHLGFDEAFLVPGSIGHMLRTKFLLHPFFWRNGVRLTEVDEFVQEVGERLPNFKFNFFVQYKIPELVSGNRGAEWNSWERSYYRYRLKAHQQDALAQLQLTAGQRAAVAYASAAFLTSEDLFKFVKSERVVQESNIASAGRMTGHTRYTYVSRGGNGMAHSEAQEIEGPAF